MKKGESGRISRAIALAALEIAPMVRTGGSFTAIGGRRFASRTIGQLVEQGLAVYIGRGVASCRMLRAAAASLPPAAEGNEKITSITTS